MDLSLGPYATNVGLSSLFAPYSGRCVVDHLSRVMLHGEVSGCKAGRLVDLSRCLELCRKLWFLTFYMGFLELRTQKFFYQARIAFPTGDCGILTKRRATFEFLKVL